MALVMTGRARYSREPAAASTRGVWREYRVGDTAKLIVQTATRGASALITVERDGVLSRRQVPSLVEGQAIEVPITPAFAPNAFVSVLLARGRMGEGARGLPKISMGVVNLPVSHGDKRLDVQVRTMGASIARAAR